VDPIQSQADGAVRIGRVRFRLHEAGPGGAGDAGPVLRALAKAWLEGPPQGQLDVPAPLPAEGERAGEGQA
jgi:hypothetical protein